MSKRYIDYKLIDRIPNKYGFTPKNIKKVKVLDWKKLKQHTWFNQAMTKTGRWWCHLEGCNPEGKRYSDSDEFWIGFSEEGKVDCHFTAYEGMCSYNFDKFYDINEIENKYDMQVQANAIRYLNMLVDEEIISKPEG
jgi:hypothetical protein